MIDPERAATRSPIDGVGPDVFRPRMSRGYAWRRRAGQLAAAVLILVALPAGVAFALRTCGGLGTGLSRIDGQCVGVTDGSSTFSSDPDLDRIEALIKAENDRVAQQGTAYVRIALLSPLTADQTSFLSHDQVLHALEGVYVAQLRANTSRSFADPNAALIQVLLANEGIHQDRDQWQQVVGQLEGMTGGPHPLVAVVGMGTSIAQTRDAALHLSNHNVPMVGAVISADGLDGAHIPGLIRVSPSNSDYAESLRRYLQQTRPGQRGMLVYDRSMPDLYVNTLQSAYQARLQEFMTYPSKSFVGLGNLVPGTPQLFKGITDAICPNGGPDLVLFAGRGLDLPGFIESLAASGCGQRPIAVVVGATGLSFTQRVLTDLGTHNLVVIDAASTDPRWRTGEVAAPAGYRDFLTAFLKVDSGRALDDGYAIMHHDALVAAVMAARLAASQGTLSTLDVEGQLYNLSGTYAVPGASGTLVFSQSRGGNAGGKPVPIIEYPGTATPVLRAAAPYQTPPT